MLVDEITITAKAGDGGDGVVRWRHEKFRPLAGPAGGDGGQGGDVYVEAVADINALAYHTGKLEFHAESGQPGQSGSKDGRRGKDCIITVPVGSVVTDIERGRTFELLIPGQREKVLVGGRGGRGNEHFMSSTNRSPEETTKGRLGEVGTFRIELSLIIDVGLIGLPNAGKSTLLNLLTNAQSKVGAYPFTTLSPHLGALHEFVIADIPGIIAGASEGKGLGLSFLKHITRTKMHLHLLSLEEFDPIANYYTTRDELHRFNPELLKKEEWVIFTKKDLINKDDLELLRQKIDKLGKRVFFITEYDEVSVKVMSDELVRHLRNEYNKSITT